MDLELTSEQRELYAVARQALDSRAPLSLSRGYLNGAPEAPLHGLIVDLGWSAVGLDPDDGFGLAGLVLLAEQVGAHAAPAALVDTAVAARVATEMGSAHAEKLREGTTTCALAALESGTDWGLHSVMSTLTGGPGGWLLNGEKIGVQHGASTELLLVITVAGGELAAALIAADAPGVSVQSSASADPSTAPVSVSLRDVPVNDDAVLVGEAARTTLRSALRVGAVATAAEGIGAASAALELAIAHAGEREQFGRPIGSFQGLKHVIADAHVDRESAWSSVLYAAAALDESLPDAHDAAAVACAYAARASRNVVEAALQVLGGIAFTWEHDVHLLQRRVLSCERRFGDAIDHERRLGQGLAARAAVDETPTRSSTP